MGQNGKTGAGHSDGQPGHFGLKFQWANELQIENFFLILKDQLLKIIKQQLLFNSNNPWGLELI